ncbi:hypothetical protein L3V79_08465 [Thiotrichales bacterium 19S9-12]|nr:hypothetical protein [Thiotrichales bacterium 19S9-11]MCF6812387.1 hypothetical protein [Thiotrichales bacterium 19S9-12]
MLAIFNKPNKTEEQIDAERRRNIKKHLEKEKTKKSPKQVSTPVYQESQEKKKKSYNCFKCFATK